MKLVSVWDIFLWTFLLIFWFIPSALFWHLALNQQIFLPHIPRYFWLLPGELWQKMPWLFIIFIVVLSVLFIFVVLKYGIHLRKVRFVAYIILALTTCIHLLWGGAILIQ